MVFFHYQIQRDNSNSALRNYYAHAIGSPLPHHHPHFADKTFNFVLTYVISTIFVLILRHFWLRVFLISVGFLCKTLRTNKFRQPR